MKKLVILLLAFSALSNAQSKGTLKSTDGTPIFCRIFGGGKPLLIINGGPGMNSNGFEDLARTLSESGNLVVIYDQRGTGKSKVDRPNSSNITMDLMVSDIEAIRTQMKFNTWNVLGHSFGGMLASYYAAVHPDAIDKLVLSSSGGIDLELLNNRNIIRDKLSKTQRDSLDYWEARINNGDTTFKARLGRGRALAPAYVVNPRYYPTIAKRLTEGNRTINALVWQDLNRMHFDCAQKLKTFKKPVLIIQGKQDIVPEKLAEKAHSVFENSKVVLLENSSHYGWLDAERAYFAEIKEFLKT